MKRFVKKIRDIIQHILNTLIRFILGIIYFVIFFPICFFIKQFSDFLDIKNYNNPHWLASGKIENIEDFLHQQ